MKLNLKNLLFFMLVSLGFSAQAVTIDGHVYFGEGIPAPGYEVTFHNISTDVTAAVVTDDEGYFSKDFEETPGEPNIVEVSVFDLCFGSLIIETVDLAADFTTVDFIVCNDFFPPLDSLCNAAFSYQQIDSDELTVEFINLSYSDNDVESWSWDFGDGSSSTEEAPSHTYAEQGSYEVVLTMTAGDCNSTISDLVLIGEPGWCNCPDFFEPVCAVLPGSVDTIEFINMCFALCEGITPDQLFSCDDIDPCICTGEWAPICVMTMDSILLSFGNLCEAECAGFTADDLVPCEDECLCSTEWNPVCVELPGGFPLTFGNECLAICEGFTPDDFVDCDNDCICEPYWDPVCVLSDNGQVMTFGNECEAACAGFSAEDFVDCEDPCICVDDWNPVCVSLDSISISFPNLCEAECAGFTAEDIVDCNDPCICPEIWDPVCVAVPGGLIITFSNLCEAECAGFTADDLVECVDPCSCPDIWEPVCVTTIEGITITFGNLCEAECAGYTVENLVDCNPDCVCEEIWDPVCIALPFDEGFIITFPNACTALCEGFTPDMFVECDSTGCICPQYYSPVCVITEDGTTLTFDNECYAECAGYSDYLPCDGFNSECFASFNIVDIPGTPGTHTFSFMDASWVLEGEITSWSWDFGDGTTSTDQNPTHEYTESGIFTILLTIESSMDCSSTFEEHICVGDGGFIDDYDCQAIFFFEQESGLSYNFQDFSFEAPSTWAWDFGDGTISDEQNPSHTYEAEGLYVVSLTIGTDDCESTTTMLVVAGEYVDYQDECFALFIPMFEDENPFFNDSLGFEGVLFLNLSSAVDGEVLWDFGDGTTSTEFMPFHNYTENGTYEVSLTVTEAGGCTSTYSGAVDIISNEFVGSPVYSLTTADEEVATAIQKVVAYPNPTTNKASVQFTMPQASDYSLELLDINGKLVSTKTQKGSAGINTDIIDLSQLTNGLYLIKITTGQISITSKVIKN